MESNKAAFGGAVYAALNATLDVTRSVLVGNSAGTNGGLLFAFTSETTIANSTMSDNVATARGGALAVTEVWCASVHE